MRKCSAATIVVLAVKPQDAKARCVHCRNVAGKLVLSIAAGVTLETLSRWLGGHRKLVRCMPNTPALIGAGIAGLYALPEVSADEKSRPNASWPPSAKWCGWARNGCSIR